MEAERIAITITLEEALQRADMSARELAWRVGCSKDTVSQYRYGRVRKVNIDLLELFCAVLHCLLSALLSDKPPTSVQPSSERSVTAQPQADHRHPGQLGRLLLSDG